MIKANHKKWAEFIFEMYITRLFRKSFSSLNLIGEIPEIQDNQQVIVLPNHSSWWDGFFVWYLNKIYFERKFYIMMLESRLEKYNFFSKLGAFSINQTNPKSIIETFTYINEILKSKDKVLLNYYPQGELLPNFYRPINIQPGILKVISKYDGNLSLLPLGIKIEFLKERLPLVFFNFGKLISTKNEKVDSSQKIQNSIENCLITINKKILEDNYGEAFFEGKKSPT